MRDRNFEQFQFRLGQSRESDRAQPVRPFACVARGQLDAIEMTLIDQCACVGVFTEKKLGKLAAVPRDAQGWIVKQERARTTSGGGGRSERDRIFDGTRGIKQRLDQDDPTRIGHSAIGSLSRLSSLAPH